MRKFLAVTLLLCLFLTGCTYKVNVSGTNDDTSYSKLSEDATRDKDSTGQIEAVGEVHKATKEVTNREPSSTSDAWSFDNMDEEIRKFYVDMYGWNLLTYDLDKVKLTDYELVEPTDDVPLYQVLSDFMLIKYSEEWNIGISDKESSVTWTSLDDLARKFGLKSSAYASEIYDAESASYNAGLPQPSVTEVGTYEYSNTFSDILGEYQFADGVTPTIVKVATEYTNATDELWNWAYIAYDEDGNTLLNIPGTATSRVLCNGTVYWLVVPNAWFATAEDMSFDTHSDVTIVADWKLLIEAMGADAIDMACTLDPYKFKEDHGIMIVREDALPTISEAEFKELIVDYVWQYIDTDYTVELDHIPSKTEYAAAIPPYQLWLHYFGIDGMSDGARVERLSGDFSFWEDD